MSVAVYQAIGVSGSLPEILASSTDEQDIDTYKPDALNGSVVLVNADGGEIRNWVQDPVTKQGAWLGPDVG